MSVLTAEDVYGALKRYIQETLLGGGAVAGKNVTISNIDPIEGGNRITFSYTLDGGEQKTSTLDVMNGEDGFSPTIAPNPDNTDDNYRLDITDINGTFTTPNLKGEGGGDSENCIESIDKKYLKEFTGTTEEYEKALREGKIKDNTIVNITDDYEEEEYVTEEYFEERMKPEEQDLDFSGLFS